VGGGDGTRLRERPARERSTLHARNATLRLGKRPARWTISIARLREHPARAVWGDTRTRASARMAGGVRSDAACAAVQCGQGAVVGWTPHSVTRRRRGGSRPPQTGDAGQTRGSVRGRGSPPLGDADQIGPVPAGPTRAVWGADTRGAGWASDRARRRRRCCLRRCVLLCTRGAVSGDAGSRAQTPGALCRVLCAPGAGGVHSRCGAADGARAANPCRQTGKQGRGAR
jgi:hypothetical protein